MIACLYSRKNVVVTENIKLLIRYGADSNSKQFLIIEDYFKEKNISTYYVNELGLDDYTRNINIVKKNKINLLEEMILKYNLFRLHPDNFCARFLNYRFQLKNGLVIGDLYKYVKLHDNLFLDVYGLNSLDKFELFFVEI